MCFEAVESVAAHDEPDFECAEAPAKGDGPVAVVDYLACFGVCIAEVGWGDVEGVDEVVSVADEEEAISVSNILSMDVGLFRMHTSRQS